MSGDPNDGNTVAPAQSAPDPTAAASLAWCEDGRPRSTAYDDIYFAPDGLAESRTVFLQGCGLPEAWAGRARFTVAELGFGTGLNILALLQLWRDTRPPCARLHLFSIEAHPLEPDDARRALASFPEIADLARPLLARWPGRARGFERHEWPELGVLLDLATAEAAEALEAWSGPADAWFLDGFAPSRNPAMWRPEVLDLVTARSRPDARLATFTVAGAVRRGLSERGWSLTRAPGHGGKRERLQARLPGPAGPPEPPTRVRVLGAGIAGASLARAFARMGVSCTVIDPAPASGASGNPAALVAPRLDAGGGPIARLAAQAFSRAVDLYEAETPHAVVERGALRLPSSTKDLARFEAIRDSGLFRPRAIELLEAEPATARLGEPCEAALWIADAVTIAPAAVLETWLADAGPEVDAEGEGEVVCIAAGAGASALLPAELLEPVAGQASWTTRARLPGAPASWGAYAIPTPEGGVLFGATHERGVAEPVVTADANRRNLQVLHAPLPGLADAIEPETLHARVGVRMSTPDRLPLAGALGDGQFVLGGLGGRGFTWAPLLAEHVAAMVVGAPSPLPRDLAALVDPRRFQDRAERRRFKTASRKGR